MNNGIFADIPEMKGNSGKRERPARGHGERGQMIPLLAFALIVILGIAALTVDVGYWRYQQRLEQSAADAAATAGAIALFYPTTSGSPAPPEVEAAAQQAASDNGYKDDGGVTVSVIVNDPPVNNTPPNAQATPYAPKSAVEAIITKSQPSFFGGIFGRKTQPVSARAVAVLQPDKTPQCLSQLLPNGGIGLNAGNIVAVNCSVAANGYVSVGRGIDATSLTYHGSVPSGSTTHNGISIAPIYSGTPIVDPCFKIPGCNYLQNTPIPPLDTTAINAIGMFVISAPPPPGYAVVKNCCLAAKFNPGLYYIYGGISGAVTGTGVTLVNVDGASRVSGSGIANLNVTAPSTFGPPDNAPTAGVAFYQPPSNSNPITNNGLAATWEGLFYAPSAQFVSNGSPDTFSMLVIGSYAISGNKTLTINPALSPALGLTSAQATTHVALAE